MNIRLAHPLRYHPCTMPALTLSDPQRIAIVESVRRGTPPARAFAANGLTRETWYRWRIVAAGADHWPGTDQPVDPRSRQRCEQVVTEVAQAQSECFSVLTDALYANATTINPKTQHSDTQAADKLLSKHEAYRSEWHEERHIQVEQQPPADPAEQWALAASRDEVLAAADPELVKLLALPPPSTDPPAS